MAKKTKKLDEVEKGWQRAFAKLKGSSTAGDEQPLKASKSWRAAIAKLNPISKRGAGNAR